MNIDNLILMIYIMDRYISKGGTKMTTLIHWHRAPDVRTMENNLSRLVNEFLRGGLRDKRAWKQSSWTPAVDMCEGDQAFTLTAESGRGKAESDQDHRLTRLLPSGPGRWA